MKYIAKKLLGNEWVVTYDDIVIVNIPDWWRNKKSIAIFIADSMNRNTKLVLEPEI